MMQRRGHHVHMTSTRNTITLRSASVDDHAELADLAALDSRRLHSGSYLVAEDGGTIVAAVAETDGSAIADPFRRTAETVELLRSRREQLLIARNHGTRRRRVGRIARASASRAA